MPRPLSIELGGTGRNDGANLSSEVRDASYFGAVGDWNGTTGTDDTTALRAAFAAIQSGEIGAVNLGHKRYRVYSDGSTTPLADLSSLRGFGIISYGAQLVIDRTFTVGQIYQMFQFTACNDFVIWPINVDCTQSQTGTGKYDRGFEVFKILQGCAGMYFGPMNISNVRSAVMFRRESTDPSSYISRGATIAYINASSVGYPLNCILSGHDLKANINTDACTRSYFPYGVSDHVVHVRSKNHEGNCDCLISTAQGIGNDNVDLTYIDTDSTTTDNSIHAVKVQFGDQTAAVQRKIKLNINIALGSGKYVGRPLRVEKLDNGGAADTVDRGHILESLDADITLVSSTGSQPSIDLCATGTWGAGEYIRNVDLRFRSDGAGQPTINLSSLKDVARIKNTYSSAQINLTGNTDSLITVENFSSSSGTQWSITAGSRVNFLDTGRVAVSYSASMTPDAAAASRQIITATNGTAFTINAPTNPAADMRMTVTIKNTSGGALGAATWNGVFKMSAWTQPANGFNRSITFENDGTNWIEISRTPADVAN